MYIQMECASGGQAQISSEKCKCPENQFFQLSSCYEQWVLHEQHFSVLSSIRNTYVKEFTIYSKDYLREFLDLRISDRQTQIPLLNLFLKITFSCFIFYSLDFIYLYSQFLLCKFVLKSDIYIYIVGGQLKGDIYIYILSD